MLLLINMLILWTVVFIVSLIVLVKGADWLIASAEKIGLSIGLSPFIVGVIIVGLGTSFPELISSLAAVFSGATEIVTSNAVGSNIANILLVVGISAIVGKKLTVTKSLINLDLPLLSIGTVLFLGVIIDKQINFGEALLLLVAYTLYLIYTFVHKDELDEIQEKEKSKILPSRQSRRKNITIKSKSIRPKITFKDILLLILGIIFLTTGAKFLIDSLIKLSEILNIATGVIAISAVALGTSLPELIVSVKAASQHKSDVALGNIFGSNVFNILVVIGIPALFKTLQVDQKTFIIGIPTMALATLLFVISGISRKIYLWEGTLYLFVYALFIIKLFNWF